MLRVTLDDAIEAEKIFTDLMGDQVEPRKDFINKKPEYKATLDEIKKDTEIVGATNEEFQEAIKEIETSENSGNKYLRKYKTKKGI